MCLPLWQPKEPNILRLCGSLQSEMEALDFIAMKKKVAWCLNLSVWSLCVWICQLDVWLYQLGNSIGFVRGVMNCQMGVEAVHLGESEDFTFVLEASTAKNYEKSNFEVLIRLAASVGFLGSLR